MDSVIFKKLPIFLLALFLFPPITPALNFTFSSFDTIQARQLILEGDATVSGSTLDVTNQKYGFFVGVYINSEGRALYREAMQLWDVKGTTKVLADFTTRFSLDITPLDSELANYTSSNGFTFFLVPENAKWFPGADSRGFFGLFKSEASALNDTIKNQVVAVEFDTYTDDWDPTNNDHIGVNVNSIKSQAWTTYNSTGDNATVWITYNSTMKNLTASLSFNGNSDSYTVSYIIDLSDVLPQMVQVGFTAESSSFVFQDHQVLSWSFNSNLHETTIDPRSSPKAKNNPNHESSPDPKSSPSPRLGVYLTVGLVGLFVTVLITVAIMYYLMSHKKAKDDQTRFDDLGPKKFSYSQLSRATNNFAKERKLGAGGFGDVYEGSLTNPKIKVAVKKLRSGSNQGEKEFISEVNIIGNLRHRNIVSLKGWSHDHGKLLLVYEFMPNRSLDFHLYGKPLPPLPWSTRYTIATGLASALHYIHEENEQCVVHRDIKSSNVMLDSEFNPRLGDFGLARFMDHGQSLKTTIPAGTLGYLAPECIRTGKSRKESDIYSFGIVLLEIACGRRPIEPQEEDPGKVNLVEWVVYLHSKGLVLEALDKALNAELDENQARMLMVVALWCCHPNPSCRPSIKQAIAALNGEALLPSLSQVIVPVNISWGMDFPSYGQDNIDVASGSTKSSKNYTSDTS